MLTNTIALVLAISILAIVWILIHPLVLIFLAIVLAEAFSPIVERFARFLPRVLAIVAVYLIVTLAVIVAGWWLGPQLVEQGRQLVLEAPRLVEEGEAQLDEFGVDAGQRANALEQAIQYGSSLIVSLPGQLVSSLVDVFAIVFLSIYWLITMPALSRFARSLLPANKREEIIDVLDEAGSSMGGYVRGVVIDAFIMGVITTAGLWVIGFEYPVVGGLITAIGELFPVVGPIIAAVPIVAIAFLDSPQHGLIVLAFYIVIQQVEAQIVTPFVMHSQTNVSEVLVLFALVSGGLVGGLLGAIVAIPLAGALRVFVVRAIAPWIRSRVAT